jgi:hypothetical protein
MSIFESSWHKQLLLALAIGLLAAGPALAGSDEPSGGAEGMPGAKGTIEFKPQDWQSGSTTWWKDSDGIDPGVAGCHIGTDSEGKPNGRMFGEACLDDTRLVESNPGTDELHSHSNDLGHPDTFDCNAWCVGKGAPAGSCEAAPAPPCEKSARCVCSGDAD